jgi:hypothetical protein
VSPTTHSGQQVPSATDLLVAWSVNASSPTEAPTQPSDNTNPPTAISLTTVHAELRRAALAMRRAWRVSRVSADSENSFDFLRGAPLPLRPITLAGIGFIPLPCCECADHQTETTTVGTGTH